MLFYDFEVFKYDWLVVILDMDTQKEHVIINSPDQLKAFYESHKEDIWTGFNNRHYDQYIFKGILCGFDPHKISDFIIRRDQPGWKFSALFRNIPLNNYDVMLITDRGLKFFEGVLGHDIRESSVPFDIDRKLTEKEIEETIFYCRHDVEQTIEVFLQRKSEFDTMMYFIKHFEYPLSYISKTKSQLAATMLGGNSRHFEDEFKFKTPKCLDIQKYKYVVDWYQNPANHDYKKSLKTQIAGIEHTFGWGGIHGDPGKPIHETGIFLMVDVTAYYPSMQKCFRYGYRTMSLPKNFEFIHDSNIHFKKLGDKKARQPFKIMDNAISGQMKQETSTLFDPMGNNSICVSGQLLLLDLIEHLEKNIRRFKLIQSNTDGILLKLADYDDFDIVDDTVYEWEKRTGLEMAIDTFFGDLFQKDVNNYLLVDKETGAVKSKGGYVKKLSSLDWDLAIVNRAITEYMVHGTSPKETIESCDDLKDFQQVKKIGSKYDVVLHGGRPLKEKCVRVFASKDPKDGGLTKVHAITKKPAKVASTPEHCFLYNDSVEGLKCPEKLDKAWYIALTNKRLEDFGVI